MLDDVEYLEKLVNTRMPFGKYAGRYLIDLPEPYVVWFSRNGWPAGQTGKDLQNIYIIKENGLEAMLRPLIKNRNN